MRDLKELRHEIDSIDTKIVDLIERRMSVSKEVGDYKASIGMPIYDPSREKEVIEKRIALLNDKKLEKDIDEIFELIMKLSRDKQVRE